MENDETTAERPPTSTGEQPRRRSRRGAAPTPTPETVAPTATTPLPRETGEGTAPVTEAAVTAESPNQQVKASARPARTKARPATTETASVPPARRSARGASPIVPPDPADIAVEPPVSPTPSSPGRAPRPRRATRAAVQQQALPTQDLVAEQELPVGSTADVSVESIQPAIAEPPAQQPAIEIAAVETQAIDVPLAPTSQPAELEVNNESTAEVQPEEARSTKIAAGLRAFFATLPEPSSATAQPASFLRGLAAELRAVGIRPPAPVATTSQAAAPRTEVLVEPADEPTEDVSQSLADLDLEHASSAVIRSAITQHDDQGDDGESDGDKAEERLFGRRRRRRGGRGRGGLMSRAEGEAESGVAPTGPDSLESDLDALIDGVEQPLAPRPAATFSTPPVIPPTVSPAPPQRSWKDHGPRRPWLAAGTNEAAPPAAATESVDPRRFVPAPEVDRRTADPFGMPAALSTVPSPSEATTGQGGGGIERALERQGALLQTFLERQARLLEAVVNGMSVMRRSVDDVVARQERMATEQRAGLPRTGIFVDAPNVCYAADASKVALDFSRMLSHLSRGREVVHAIAYAPVSEESRDGQRFESQRFVAPFARKGFKMVTKPLKRYPDGTAKGNFDIELAIDIVTMSERLDVVVLVSGDSDFSRLVELVQSKGVRVEVVAFASSVAPELVHMADVFVDIGQNLDYFRQL